MTREEADFIGGMNMCDEISNEAYKKIMCHCKEQEPCGDAISRQAVIDLLYGEVKETYTISNGRITYRITDINVDDLMNIPSVTPQPCEDAISIDNVIEWLKNKDIIKLSTQEEIARKELRELLSVSVKEKTGRWIMPVQDDGMSDPIYYQVRCSECGFDLDPQTWHQELHQYGADKYCPRCGCLMREVEE